jgi:2'-5' RNA ligase
MPFAVQLYFDPETEAAILSVREKLVRRGIHPIPDEMFSRPHLTLGTWHGRTPVELTALVEALAGSLPVIDVLFGSAGVFPGREGMIFLAPLVTAQLLEFHARLHREIGAPGLDPDRSCLPDNWAPHVTLAISLADWEMHAAIDIAREAPMPLSGRISALGVIEFPPVRETVTFPLRRTDVG